jgi:hypothetical protein
MHKTIVPLDSTELDSVALSAVAEQPFMKVIAGDISCTFALVRPWFSRHLVSAEHYRNLRASAFEVWSRAVV